MGIVFLISLFILSCDARSVYYLDFHCLTSEVDCSEKKRDNSSY